MSHSNSSKRCKSKPSNPHNTSKPKAEKRKVRAITRIRPFFGKSSNDDPLESCVECLSSKQIAFQQQKYHEILQQTFDFDAVYNMDSNQEQIFQNEVEPLLEHCLNGKKCTIFCYGPTGSGKTFTAFGKCDNLGIMARAIGSSLHIKATKMDENINKNNNYQCKIYLSSLEIYNERVYDLLSKDQINQNGLKVVQFANNIIVKDLMKKEINSMELFYDLYNNSIKRRKTAFTALNAHSSRSHAIFTIYFEQTMNIDNNKNKTRSIKSKISIADLAGSEDNNHTGNTGDRLRESSNINKSLLALGAVIDALNKRIKAPYRDSVLTRLLSDCLGGDSISTMICCVSGDIKDSTMTRRCLEFGSNTRKIENKVIAHIENKENRNKSNTSGKTRKRKRIDTRNNKRRKLKHNASSSSSVNISSNSSFINGDNNKKKKERKYRMKPTPSKFIKDEAQLQQHEQIVGGKIMSKIDELIKVNAQQPQSKEIEREVSVYENDKFGLPPSYTPNVANAVLAVYYVRKGKKYESKGKLKKALRQYQSAVVFLKKHGKLQKKIDLLRWKLESKMVKQLSFDNIESEEPQCIGSEKKLNADNEKKLNVDNEKNAPRTKTMEIENKGKGTQMKRKRKLKTKSREEIMDSDNDIDMNGNDSDVSERDCLELAGFSYDVNKEKLLDVMNTSTKVQLESLKTVGTKKAGAIKKARPFQSISDLRKITGLHTFKSWKNFIEGNQITFKKVF